MTWERLIGLCQTDGHFGIMIKSDGSLKPVVIITITGKRPDLIQSWKKVEPAPETTNPVGTGKKVIFKNPAKDGNEDIIFDTITAAFNSSFAQSLGISSKQNFSHKLKAGLLDGWSLLD